MSPAKKLADLLAVLEHDELVLAVCHHEFKAARDRRNRSLWVQNRHLLFVVQVIEAQLVRLIRSGLATLSATPRHINVKFVLQARVFLLSTLVELIADVPHDPKVGLHVQIAPDQLGKIRGRQGILL